MPDLTRRSLLVAGLASVPLAAGAAEPVAWDFTFPDIDGGALPLARFKGKALMVVNTASFCGFTYQYEALEKLYRERRDAGLVIIGVPSQDFHQESDSNAKVKTFCESTFGVEFPLAGISRVMGEDAAPFYQWVKSERHWEPSWNFNKVIIDRAGHIVACFGSGEEPESFKVRLAIRKALATVA
jgi:glutathione peroxidase